MNRVFQKGIREIQRASISFCKQITSFKRLYKT